MLKTIDMAFEIALEAMFVVASVVLIYYITFKICQKISKRKNEQL
jgi:hypothetical protein